MKKFLTILLSVLMIASLCAFQVSAEAKVVYVGGEATVEEKGTGTKDDPFSKLSLAIKALAKTGGEIVLLSDIDLLYEYTNDTSVTLDKAVIGSNADNPCHIFNPTHAGDIVIRSESADAIKTIYFKAQRTVSSWSMGGNTTFKNVKFDFKTDGTYKRVFANGYDLIFDEGTTAIGTDTYFYPGISYFTTEQDKVSRKVTDNKIVFKSGSWGYLFGAQLTNCGADLNYTYYVLGSASIAGYAAPGTYYKTPFGNANLVVDTTGTIAAIHSAHSAGVGTVNISILNGNVTAINYKTLADSEAMKAINVSIAGGTVGKVVGTGTTAEANNLYVKDGLTVTATDITAAKLTSDLSYTVPGAAAACVADPTAKLTVSGAKPNAEIKVDVTANTNGAVAIYAKDYDLAEGYGAPLMVSYVNASDKSVTLVKEATEETEAGLAEGEYVAVFYAAGYADAVANTAFTVKAGSEGGEGTAVPTGDEVVFVAIAVIVSAMAAAFVLRRKAI